LHAYYRKFIHGFADIAKPLTRLVEEKRTFELPPEAAFLSFKEALCTALVLGNPRPGEKIIFDIDASNTEYRATMNECWPSSANYRTPKEITA
jgi:hypothetical protein